MENMMGLLRIKVLRGINLAVRDACSSDPYVIVRMGKQAWLCCTTVQTFQISQAISSTYEKWGIYLVRVENDDPQGEEYIADGGDYVEKKDVKLEEHSKLKTSVVKKNLNPEWNEELTLTVADPNQPIKLQVYDRDMFSLDDKMGDAEFDIKEFLRALKMKLENVPSGTVITKVAPNRENCLSEESSIVWENGKVMQRIFLRLKNVESGEIELELHWIDVPGSRGL